MNLELMSAKEVLEYAKQKNIHIPTSCKSKSKAIKCILFAEKAIKDLDDISNFSL